MTGWRRSLWQAPPALLLVGVIVAGWAYHAWERHEQRVAVLRLEPAERRAVFEAAMEGYRHVCTVHSGDSVEDYCETQRDFIALFPECDSTCQVLLVRRESQPTR